MRDTIDLLELIGRDASLRHASAQNLAEVLKQADATPCLTMAVASRDSSILEREFGVRSLVLTQATQAVAWEERYED